MSAKDESPKPLFELDLGPAPEPLPWPELPEAWDDQSVQQKTLRGRALSDEQPEGDPPE